MNIRALLTGSFIFVIGIFMVIKAFKKTKMLNKFEFEHRASNGEVIFDSKASSRTHVANKNLYRVIGVFGFFVGLLGLIFMGYGFVLWYYLINQS